MEIKALLLGALRYENAKGKGTRISYVFLDKDGMSNNEKFHGFAELSFYCDSDAFDKIPVDLFGKAVTISCEEVPYSNNPMKKRTKVTKINDISLV